MDKNESWQYRGGFIRARYYIKYSIVSVFVYTHLTHLYKQVFMHVKIFNHNAKP